MPGVGQRRRRSSHERGRSPRIAMITRSLSAEALRRSRHPPQCRYPGSGAETGAPPHEIGPGAAPAGVSRYTPPLPLRGSLPLEGVPAGRLHIHGRRFLNSRLLRVPTYSLRETAVRRSRAACLRTAAQSALADSHCPPTGDQMSRDSEPVRSLLPASRSTSWRVSADDRLRHRVPRGVHEFMYDQANEVPAMVAGVK